MKETIKKKWLAKLRNKKTKQSKDRLKDKNGGFCCLGVLCDIYSKDKKVSWTKNDWILGEWASLPTAVVDWAGLPSNNPEVEMGDDFTDLATLNDSGNYTFEDIAEIIEKQL